VHPLERVDWVALSALRRPLDQEWCHICLGGNLSVPFEGSSAGWLASSLRPRLPQTPFAHRHAPMTILWICGSGYVTRTFVEKGRTVELFSAE
jgi:hypothetical protein